MCTPHNIKVCLGIQCVDTDAITDSIHVQRICIYGQVRVHV